MALLRRIRSIGPVLLAVCALASCSKKGVDLKFNYAPGQATQYRMTSEVKTRASSTGIASTGTTNYYTLSIDLVANAKVLKVLDNGDAVLEFTYDKVRYLNTGNPANADEVIRQIKALKINLTLSPYGEITDIKGYENIPKVYIEDLNIFNILMKALPIFPRVPINLGMQWEREQTFPIENGLIKGNMLVYKRFSLLDTASKEGSTLARIGSEISMKFDVPKSESFTLSQDGNERMGLFGTGTIQFDATGGEVLRANAAVFGKLIVGIKHPISGNPVSTRLEIAQNISVSKL
jgi:hypothetical protein